MSTITQYRIVGICGAGYAVGMVYDGGERKWRRADRDDGRCVYTTRAAAEADLDDARADADVRDVCIEEDEFEVEE